MSDIEWGEPIEVNGVKPYWLGDEDIAQGFSTGGFSYAPAETVGWHWPKIRTIRLNKDHPYYSNSTNDYTILRNILNEAYEQAANGKGKERHANGKSWGQQPIAEIGRMVGVGFNTGQAIKKLQESSRMEPDAACRELLGAIVYAASAIMLIREDDK